MAKKKKKELAKYFHLQNIFDVITVLILINMTTLSDIIEEICFWQPYKKCIAFLTTLRTQKLGFGTVFSSRNLY